MSGRFANRLTAVWRRLVHFGRASTFERELDEEIAIHIEMRADELHQEGMPRADAIARARREFGSSLRVKEETRAAWQFRWLEETLSDLSYAARALRRNPGFAAAAIVSLALGIGANTTIFSLTMEFLFSEPSGRNPGTLAAMRVGGNSHAYMRHYRFLRDAHIFPGLAGSNEEAESNWRSRDETYRLHAMRVTDNFFGVVGVPLAMGRPIETGDRDVVVLSDRFWRTRLGAETDVIGRALTIDGRPYTVSGVLPPDHRTVLGFGFSPDVYLPASRENDRVALIARLPDGMSLQAAYGRLTAACQELDKVYPPEWSPQASWVTNTDIVPVAGMARLRNLRMVPFVAFFSMLLTVVGLVLLIACANVSNLLLARASARRQELAIRLALGAGRRRIVRQLLAESLLLALLGTGAGLLLNLGMAGVLNRVQLPLPIPVHLLIRPDWRLLLYSAVIAMASALVAGLLPALKATRGGVTATLKRTERQVEGRWSLRGGLIVMQLAVSVVLLTMGVLFVRNMTRSMTMSPGFDADGAVWASVRLVPEMYPTEEQVRSVTSAALSELRALPGVEAASVARVVPLNGNSVRGDQVLADASVDPVRVRFHNNEVGPDYFRTLGIPILAGREFVASDRKGAPEVAILNENLARRLFGDRNAVGRTFRYPAPTLSAPITVVGVAANSKYFTLGEESPMAMYSPYSQGAGGNLAPHLLVRSSRPEGLVRAIARTLGALDPSAAIDVKPMRNALGFALLPSRIGAALLGSAALVGLALASIGLYGVLAYSVTRRTPEIGLRMALGADGKAVLIMVLRESGRLVGWGVAVGLGVAVFAVRPLAMFLVSELSPTDPMTFLGVIGVLSVVAVGATLAPAMRAIRVDPMTALRSE
jgi:putative ABC transport system permease protein